MNKKLLYGQGYNIVIHSYENDLDSPNTTIVKTMNKYSAIAFYSLLKCIHDNPHWQNDFHVGSDVLDKILELNRDVLERWLKEDKSWTGEADIHLVSDMIYDLGLSGNDYLIRALDNFYMFHLDNDVAVDIITDIESL